MCGFVVCFSPAENNKNKLIITKKKLQNSFEYIKHRGPDENNFWFSKNLKVGLAHARLSIVDIKQGSQPMVSQNNRYVLVFNGIIYNYLELKKKLNRITFKTKSDSEVILKYYELYKEKCVDHFRGMFSFVIYDNLKNEIFAARDRMGIKPMYYTVHGKSFIFSSEIKPLFSFIDTKTVNNLAISEYLTFNFPVSDNNFIKKIFTFPKGSFLKLKNIEKINFNKYWSLSDKFEKNKNMSLDNIIKKSIDMHTVSDVPVCCYISGGLDSGYLAYYLSTKLEKLTGFHGYFEEAGFNELKYANLIAKKFNIKLKKIKITESDFVNNIEKTINSLEQPVAGPGAFCQYMVSKFVSDNGFKVVLGGQGGDEIFAGYTRYYINQLKILIQNLNYKNESSLKILNNYVKKIYQIKKYQNIFVKSFLNENDYFKHNYLNLINKLPDIKKYLNAHPNLSKVKRNMNKYYFDEFEESELKKVLKFDLEFFLSGLLHVEDRMSMAHGLESRLPYLDHKLVEYQLSQDENTLFLDGELKYSFKKILKDNLPKKVFNREDKMGFPIPLNIWIKRKTKNGLREYVNDTFSSINFRNRPFYNKKNFTEILESTNKNIYNRAIWNFLSLELWYNKTN